MDVTGLGIRFGVLRSCAGYPDGLQRSE